MILRIIADPRRPNLSYLRIKFFRSLNFWFITTYDSINFILYDITQRRSLRVFNNEFLTRNSNIKTLYINFIYGFNVISISADIFKTKQIFGGFAII